MASWGILPLPENGRYAAPVQIVAAWNGLAMGALAKASRVLANEPDQPPRQLFPVTGRPAHEYLDGEP